jgi:hypothetical protein
VALLHEAALGRVVVDGRLVRRIDARISSLLFGQRPMNLMASDLGPLGVWTRWVSSHTGGVPVRTTHPLEQTEAWSLD